MIVISKTKITKLGTAGVSNNLLQQLLPLAASILGTLSLAVLLVDNCHYIIMLVKRTNK